MSDETDDAAAAADFDEEFFDASFLSELEELAASVPRAQGQEGQHLSSVLHEKLTAFLAAPEGRLTEDAFLSLPASGIGDRTNLLLEMCRAGGRTVAAQSVENFVVFFQALLPTLPAESAPQIRRLFYRLVPTLLHIAHDDFAGDPAQAASGRTALANLESILIEIASVRLTPGESELIFRSIDQMVGFIAAAEYNLANEIISSQLLGIISRNKLTRALFRLMEVEVRVQKYLKDRLGYLTPQLRLPDDAGALSEYGPIQIFAEEGDDGTIRRFIQVHLPDIAILRDIVLHLVGEEPGRAFDFRFDALGTAELLVPDGLYSLGLVYQP